MRGWIVSAGAILLAVLAVLWAVIVDAYTCSDTCSDERNWALNLELYVSLGVLALTVAAVLSWVQSKPKLTWSLAALGVAAFAFWVWILTKAGPTHA